MPPTKKLYLKFFSDNKRLMTDDEAFDFYSENIMRNSATCKFNPYRTQYLYEQGIKKRIYDDYTIYELKTKAKIWHQNLIGWFVLSGIIKIQIEE